MTYRQAQEPEPEVVESVVVETVREPSTVMVEDDVPLLIPDAPETLPEEFLPSVEEPGPEVVGTAWEPPTVMTEDDVPPLIPDAPETPHVEPLPPAEEPLPVNETEIFDPWAPEDGPDMSGVSDFQEAGVQEISEDLPYAEEPVIQETVENPEPAGLKAEAPSGGEWAWISPADTADADHDEPEPVEDLPSESPLPVSSGKQESTEFRPWTEILSGQPVGWLIADAALVLIGIISLVVSIVRPARRKHHSRKSKNRGHDGRSGGNGDAGETEDPLMQALLSGEFSPVPDEAGKGDAG